MVISPLSTKDIYQGLRLLWCTSLELNFIWKDNLLMWRKQLAKHS